MTLLELTLETAINEAGEFKDVRLSKEDAEHILSMLKEQEPIKPTINEDGEAFCVCGENVGIIPDNKNLPSIRSKYCSECGRRMKWE